MPTRTQRRGGSRGRRRFGHSPLHLLLRPRRASASDVAFCGTSSSLQSGSPLSPLYATVQTYGPDFHDWNVTRSLPGVRVEGFLKGSEGPGISDLCRTRLHLSARSAGTWTRAVCPYALGIVTWLPLRGSVAQRVACKIRLQLTEGSRVLRY